MPKITISCDWCKEDILRYPSQVKKSRNFCSRRCMNEHRTKRLNPEGYKRNFNAGHLSELNRRLNPTRMTEETKRKIREAHLGKGEGKAYPKIHQRHVHRVVAEQKLGRKLLPGEVVHHIDGDRLNNHPDNLMVFSSQAEHLQWHRENDPRYKGGGAFV